MEVGELKKIQARGKEGEATLGDVVEVVAEHFFSGSKNNKAVIDLLKQVIANQDEIRARLSRLEDNMLSPIYQAILEDDAEENGAETSEDPSAPESTA